jgi:ATP-dependent Clp protease ATP-binding subunit ClpA
MDRKKLSEGGFFLKIFRHIKLARCLAVVTVLGASAPGISHGQNYSEELVLHVQALVWAQKMNSGRSQIDFPRINEAGERPSLLASLALIYRIELEVDFKNIEKISKETILECLGELDNTIDESAASALSSLYKKLHERFGHIPRLWPNVQMKLDSVGRRAAAQGKKFPRYPENLPGYVDKVTVANVGATAQNFGIEIIKDDESKGYQPLELIEDADKDLTPEARLEKGLKKVAEMEKYFEATYFGQPEVVKAVLNLELSKVMYGQSHPDGVNVVLMGLPGTGKDTFAMSWVDAIHGRRGAWLNHMFTVFPIRSKSDISTLTGSNPGYVGSEDAPAFMTFLVKHSAGRYIIVKKNEQEANSRAKKDWYIAENPDWKPGMVIRKHGDFEYFTPDEGVVFMNEIHNWSKSGLDAVKTFMETGRMPLANPGTGSDGLPAVNELIVPIRRVIASNFLANYLAKKRSDGSQIGNPPTYEEILETWQAVQDKPEKLRDLISQEGGDRSGFGASDEQSQGLSPETLNRFKDRLLLLLRPLGPDVLKKVIRFKVDRLNELLGASTTGFNHLQVEVTRGLETFLQEWNYVAANGARPMGDRVEGVIDQGLIDAVKRGQIKPGVNTKILMDVKENSDGTSSLIITNSQGESFTSLIEMTKSNRIARPKTPEEVKDLYTLGSRLSNHVYGMDEMAQRIGDQIAVRLRDRVRPGERVAPGTNTESDQHALSMLFLGLSSTGKTEMAKAIAREVYRDQGGEKERYMHIPFGEVGSVEKFEELVSGRMIGSKFKPSRMYEMWKRTDGRFVLVLDELVNAPEALQTRLYDLLREKEFRFANGEALATENLIIIGTGNLGEEWYSEIPRQGVPKAEQQAAMYEIDRRAQADPEFRRLELEKKMKKALLNRVGLPNIYFFSPLSYRSIRELAQSRLARAIDSLKATGSRTGWNVSFTDQESLVALLMVLETEGFELFEQGASLVRFVNDDFRTPLKILLDREGVPNNAAVKLSFKGMTPQIHKGTDVTAGEVFLGVHVGDRELELRLRRQIQVTEPARRVQDKIFVAYHEAGHQIVSRILQGDLETPRKITIISGVDKIGGKFLRYDGLSATDPKRTVSFTKEYIITELAGLAGGEVAEALVSKGARTNAGKSSDMERATALAYRAILCWGLSKSFEQGTCPLGQDPYEWVAKLSKDKKRALEKEVASWLEEAKVMARNVLLANLELLQDMAVELAELGTLEEKELDALFTKHAADVTPLAQINAVTAMKKFTVTRALARFSGLWPVPAGRDQEFLPGIMQPKKLADFKKIEADNKAKALEGFQLSPSIPVDCGTLLQATGS